MTASLDTSGVPALTDRARTAVRATRRRAPVVLLLLLELGVLLLIVTGSLPALLPEGPATSIGHNSEALVVGLALTPVLLGFRALRRPRLGLAVGLGLVIGAVGVGALAVETPSLHTLNEPLFAAALVTGYAGVRPRRRSYALVSPVVVALALAFAGTDLVRLQAEAVVALVLVPVTVDVVAPWLLVDRRRTAAESRWAWAWLGALLVAPLLLTALASTLPGTAVGDAVVPVVEYAKRGTEGFWGAALLVVAGLVAVGRRDPAAAPAPQPGP